MYNQLIKSTRYIKQVDISDKSVFEFTIVIPDHVSVLLIIENNIEMNLL